MSSSAKPLGSRLTAKNPFQRLFGISLHNAFYSGVTRLVIDCIVVGVGLWIAFLIRFDLDLPAWAQNQWQLALPATLLLYYASRKIWGIPRLVWRFVGWSGALRMAGAVAGAGLLAVVLNLAFAEIFQVRRVPIGVLFLHPILVYAGWMGVRLLRRLTYNRASDQGRKRVRGNGENGRKRLILVGAGPQGLSLLQALRLRRDLRIVGFVDDNLELRDRFIEGIPVLGTNDEIGSLVKEHRIDEVILCIPAASRATFARIAGFCQGLPVKVFTVPSLSEIALGQVTIGQLRPVNMEDLLGRASVVYDKDCDQKVIGTYQHRRILVTGAGGSIGSELVRQLRYFAPSRLILLDKDENSLYETALEIREDFASLVEVVADVRDRGCLEKVFQTWKPDVVFHAAAYKHVPLMESHPGEAISNNVIGTRNVVDLANEYRARHFVFISTDKAVNPSSIMGASKRVAEMIVQQRASSNGLKTRYCCVRFGNVLGSRASVVPVFERQIRERRKVSVTHPEVRRYFMTIPEAVQLVIQAGSLGRRGEIFVLDMGDPVRIVDLARNLIRLSGLVPDDDVQIEFTGLRPGEKLFEELLLSGENGVRSTKYSKIFVAKALRTHRPHLNQALRELQDAARAQDAVSIRRILSSLEIGYQHHLHALGGKRTGMAKDESRLQPEPKVFSTYPKTVLES